MRPLDVGLQVALLGEGVRTEWADEWSLTGVPGIEIKIMVVLAKTELQTGTETLASCYMGLSNFDYSFVVRRIEIFFVLKSSNT